jgi:uncharacterized membrane protein YbhN (UPF0104 family)
MNDLSAEPGVLNPDPATTRAEATSRKSIWRWLVPGAKLALAGGLIYYLLTSGRLDLRVLAGMHLGWAVAAAMLLTLAGQVVQCVRWWCLMSSQSIHVSFATVLHLSWIGYFFGLFLPGAASGDLARGYFTVQRTPSTRLRSASTVLLDRAIGLYSLLLLGSAQATLLVISGKATSAIVAMGSVAVGLLLASTAVAAALVARPTRRAALRLVPQKLRNAAGECLESYCTQPRALSAALALSLLSSAISLLAFLPAARALGDHLSVPAAFLAGTLVFLANSLPISPGGIGVAESASSSFFRGLGTTHGAEVMLLLRVIIVVSSLPGAVLYVLYRARPRAAATN